MAGRASIVGAAATHVGKVREHNEDAHYFDADAGVFVVCDGMGGHAAGEVASALAIRTIRSVWSGVDISKLVDAWLARGTPDAKRQLLTAIRAGVIAAHDAIIADAARDESRSGMGTTLVGAMVVGNELVFAHAGDSRAYIVRDGIAMQLTEDQTLLARLLAAGIDVDVSGEGSRFRSMLTNALGIGQECKVVTFFVPLADGDRFLLCSDGISEYVKEAEIGEVLTKQPSPARAAQKLIDMALDRGGGDNATAVVVRVLEAGETPQPAEERRRDDAVVEQCPLWGPRVTAPQRLRALRIAISREFEANQRLPAHTLGDRVAWIIIEGELEIDGGMIGPGALVYPESLLAETQARDKDSLAVTLTEIRALALRCDDFRELCDEDNELGEALLEALGPLVSKPRGRATVQVQAVPEPKFRAPTLDEALDALSESLPDEDRVDPDEVDTVNYLTIPNDLSGPRPSGRGPETPYNDPSGPRPSGRGPETPYNDPSGPRPSGRGPVTPHHETRANDPDAALRASDSRSRTAPTAPTAPAAFPRAAREGHASDNLQPVMKPSPVAAKPIVVAPAVAPVPAKVAPAPAPKVAPAPAPKVTPVKPVVPPTHASRSPGLGAGPPPKPKPPLITPPRGLPVAGSGPRAAIQPAMNVAIPSPRIPAPPSFGAGRKAESHPVVPAQPQTSDEHEPEIETYIELEADDPPKPDGPDPEQESDHEEMVLSVDRGDARITETIHDSSSQTLMVTVTENVEDEAPSVPRTDALIADDSVLTPRPQLRTKNSGVMAVVSGTISMPSSQPVRRLEPPRPPEVEDDVEIIVDDLDDNSEPQVDTVVQNPSAAARRSKRISEGWDD